MSVKNERKLVITEHTLLLRHELIFIYVGMCERILEGWEISASVNAYTKENGSASIVIVEFL